VLAIILAIALEAEDRLVLLSDGVWRPLQKADRPMVPAGVAWQKPQVNDAWVSWPLCHVRFRDQPSA
jgi:hypothetical protein